MNSNFRLKNTHIYLPKVVPNENMYCKSDRKLLPASPHDFEMELLEYVANTGTDCREQKFDILVETCPLRQVC